ncbi:MAG: GNAT family N-acetyltransferase [Bacteroidota bacterium]
MIFRNATQADVSTIVEMLTNDKLGRQRESLKDPLPQEYYDAFSKISSDPNQELIVVENDAQIVGTLQLSFIHYLTYRGGMRAQIEAVRIRADQRNKGLGKELFNWAIDRAKEKGAHIVQLTTDKKRPEALKFYKSLGFEASHEGMKLQL